MEHRLQLRRRERREPDWPAAVVAGLAAGAVLMVLDLLWSSLFTGASPWVTSRMIAATLMGPDVLKSTEFSASMVAVALATHYALGVLFGVILVAISSPLRLDSSPGLASLTGAIAGLVVYVVNFYGLVALYPWFAGFRGTATALAHVVFGVSGALVYWKLERRGEVPVAVQVPT